MDSKTNRGAFAPLTPAQKQRKRNRKLDKIAQELGFDSWTKLATAAKNREILLYVKRISPAE